MFFAKCFLYLRVAWRQCHGKQRHASKGRDARADVALPDGDRLLVADPDLLGNLIDEPEIVADKHEAALVAVDGLRQTIDGLQVQLPGARMGVSAHEDLREQSGRIQTYVVGRLVLASGRKRVRQS